MMILVVADVIQTTGIETVDEAFKGGGTRDTGERPLANGEGLSCATGTISASTINYRESNGVTLEYFRVQAINRLVFAAESLIFGPCNRWRGATIDRRQP